MENTERKWKAREEQTQFIKPHLVIGVPLQNVTVQVIPDRLGPQQAAPVPSRTRSLCFLMSCGEWPPFSRRKEGREVSSSPSDLGCQDNLL